MIKAKGRRPDPGIKELADKNEFDVFELVDKDGLGKKGKATCKAIKTWYLK